jgi:hypothetical protein
MHRFYPIATSVLSVALTTGILQAQTDPGPRPGAAGAGSFYPGLTAAQQTGFNDGLGAFQEVDSVRGTIVGESGKGLGPTFNGNSCSQCHAQPAVGGSSPGMNSPQHPVPNPQVALAHLDGALNTVPSFITANGPVREARFVATGFNNNAPLDGGVHGLYTIRGRTDAVGCNLTQPDFATQLANRNVIFRIPTPVFGLGLIENTSDAALEANLSANQAQKAALGISGKLNRSGNDGSVTKFGWKAQNKSLLIFSGEAYNVEQGVSNFAFANERSAAAGCVYNSQPEDAEDVFEFANFMRLSAPPTATTSTTSQNNGKALFSTIGCAFCHSPNLTTAESQFAVMSNVTYHPYSDLAIHNMGSTLADGINQGAAGPDEFRTAPLWGVGQRLFFLHDGRTSDLQQAILQHSSPGFDCVISQSFQQFKVNGNIFQPFGQSFVCGSEANKVIDNYKSLNTSQKQDVLNFLRSL